MYATCLPFACILWLLWCIMYTQLVPFILLELMIKNDATVKWKTGNHAQRYWSLLKDKSVPSLNFCWARDAIKNKDWYTIYLKIWNLQMKQTEL